MGKSLTDLLYKVPIDIVALGTVVNLANCPNQNYDTNKALYYYGLVAATSLVLHLGEYLISNFKSKKNN